MTTLASRPFPVVIAAPSGAGKTSLAHALVEREPGVVFSVSATTRPARAYEEEGVHYYFVDAAEFDRMTADGELVEWAWVHGHRYGTPARGIERALERGQTPLLDIDVDGARQIRRRFPEAVLVFVLPPSAAELWRRLAGRGSEGDAERRRRIGNALGELPAIGEFDYVVVNSEFEGAVGALRGILEAERHRVTRAAEHGTFLARLDSELRELLERSP